MTAYFPMQYDHTPVPLSPYATFVHVPQAQYPTGSSSSASASSTSAASSSDISMLAMQRMPSLTSLPDMDVPHMPLVPHSPSYAVTPTSSSFTAMPSPSLPLASGNIRPPSWSSVFQANMSSQPLPALPLAAMSASAATPPVSPSPYMPGVSSQFYHNGQFSIEIPFASEESSKAAAEGKEQDSLADNRSQSPTSNPSSPKSRKRNRAATASSSANGKGGSNNKKKANSNQLTHNNSSQDLQPSAGYGHMSAAELKKQKHREIGESTSMNSTHTQQSAC